MAREEGVFPTGAAQLREVAQQSGRIVAEKPARLVGSTGKKDYLVEVRKTRFSS
jgi:hypothetical protein